MIRYSSMFVLSILKILELCNRFSKYVSIIDIHLIDQGGGQQEENESALMLHSEMISAVDCLIN